MSATINKCQVSHLEMLGTYYPIAGRHETEMSYLWHICSRYGRNNTGSLVALERVCSKHLQISQNTTQQNPCSVWWVSPLWLWALQFYRALLTAHWYRSCTNYWVACSVQSTGQHFNIRQAPPANDPILPISLVDGFLQVCYKSHTALYKMTPTALFWVILSTMLLFVKWGTNWFSSLATSLSNHLLDS